LALLFFRCGLFGEGGEFGLEELDGFFEFFGLGVVVLPDFLEFFLGVGLDLGFIDIVVDGDLFDQIFIKCFRLFFIANSKGLNLVFQFFPLRLSFLLQPVIKLDPDQMFLLLNL
jgi:hypothetical protein